MREQLRKWDWREGAMSVSGNCLIREAEPDFDDDAVAALMVDHLTWAIERLASDYGVDGPAGAVRYRTTALFERVFGLESLAVLPRLDDLGGDADEIRARLHAVAEARAS
jgi:hypothetical protein